MAKNRNLNAAAIWLTNLEHDKRNRPYDLVFNYKENPARYPKYDNYDAIREKNI